MNRDWKSNNALIFAQPSNWRFVRGGSFPSAAAIEIHPPKRSASLTELAALAAPVLVILLGWCLR